MEGIPSMPGRGFCNYEPWQCTRSSVCYEKGAWESLRYVKPESTEGVENKGVLKG